MAIVTHKVGAMEYLCAEGLHTPHCFTTRLGGISTGYLESLNLGMHRGDTPENVTENFRILSQILGFSLKKTVLTHQIHTDVIRVVTEKDCTGLDHRKYPACDALITNQKGLALVVFTADCTPVLLWDPVTGAVGATHAGWRGTALDIAGKTARAMAESFGCNIKNIHAAIGPNIGACHFQTDADVPQAMLQTYGTEASTAIRQDGEKYWVDLKAINLLSLQRAGVEFVEVSDACTACAPDKFWSHRLTGNRRGSQGALIVCGEEKL